MVLAYLEEVACSSADELGFGYAFVKPRGYAFMVTNICCEFICDGFHIDKTVIRIMYKLLGADRMLFVSDSIRAAGMPDGEYEFSGSPIFVRDGKVRMPDGTIAGSVLKLNHAVKNVLDHTDLPLYEVFKMASLNPAKAIRCSERIGSLEAGKDADIIIVDENINVIKTIKKGKTIYEA